MTDLKDPILKNQQADQGVFDITPAFVPTIECEGFKLRALKIDDAADMVLNINTIKIDRDTTIGLPLGLEKAKWWLAYVTDQSGRKPVVEEHFGIEINKEMIGTIGLINFDNHKCEIGYWLNDKYAGRGIMSQAIKEVVEFGFENLGLQRIFAPILTHNKASARVLTKNGFELEGTLKKFYFKDNRYIDALSYSLVR